MKIKIVPFIGLTVMSFFICGESFSSEKAIEYLPVHEIKITIPEGIDMVLKDNRLIKIENFEKDMVFEDTLLALAPLLPHISAHIEKSYYRYKPAMKFSGLSVDTAEKDPYSWGFSIYQTLFDFGKSLSTYKAATEMFHGQKAKFESIKRAVTLEFIISSYELLERQRMIEVFEKEVETLNAYLNDMEQLYKNGVIVDNDLLPAKVKLADAKQKLIAAKNNVAIMSTKLSTILTLPLEKDLTVSDIDFYIDENIDLENAWGVAEGQRPEITFFNRAIKACDLSEKAKAVKNLPTVFVEGGYDYTENRYQVHEDNSYIVFGLKADLYDGGASISEVSKAKYQKKQLIEEKQKLIDDIKYEVKCNFCDFKNAIEKVLVAKDAVKQSEENVRANREKYNSGAATSTDVLEAITLQTHAETNFYSANYELKSSYIRLMYSKGDELKNIYLKQKMEK